MDPAVAAALSWAWLEGRMAGLEGESKLANPYSIDYSPEDNSDD